MIIVPAFKYPAFRAGIRTSPIDKVNMNRSFPGVPSATTAAKRAGLSVARHFPGLVKAGDCVAVIAVEV